MVPEGGGGEGPSRRAEGADGRWRAGKRVPRGAERAREASDDRERDATHPSISKVARARGQLRLVSLPGRAGSESDQSTAKPVAASKSGPRVAPLGRVGSTARRLVRRRLERGDGETERERHGRGGEEGRRRGAPCLYPRPRARRPVLAASLQNSHPPTHPDRARIRPDPTHRRRCSSRTMSTTSSRRPSTASCRTRTTRIPCGASGRTMWWRSASGGSPRWGSRSSTS